MGGGCEERSFHELVCITNPLDLKKLHQIRLIFHWVIACFTNKDRPVPLRVDWQVETNFRTSTGHLALYVSISFDLNVKHPHRSWTLQCHHSELCVHTWKRSALRSGKWLLVSFHAIYASSDSQTFTTNHQSSPGAETPKNCHKCSFWWVRKYRFSNTSILSTKKKVFEWMA